MLVDLLLRLRQTNAVDDGRVVQRVAEDAVLLLQDGLKDTRYHSLKHIHEKEYAV